MFTKGFGRIVEYGTAVQYITTYTHLRYTAYSTSFSSVHVLVNDVVPRSVTLHNWHKWHTPTPAEDFEAAQQGDAIIACTFDTQRMGH